MIRKPAPRRIKSRRTTAIDQALRDPDPQVIGLFDDVLTTGAHFRAASAVLKQSFPGVRIVGLLYRPPRPRSRRFGDFDL